MNLFPVLVTGLFAGGVSCAAVQGGLLTGLITRQRAATAAGIGAASASDSAAGTTTGQPRWGQRVVDDLAPVGGFLAGKLLSHTVLGAVLGAVGGAVQLSTGARTWLQIGAGLLIIVFGLAQLGVPGFRGIVVEPPASWMRVLRKRARSQAALAPAVLGVSTVLIPCGVTLSVEALALASGSPWWGAAIMAVFVLGTSPLFAILGYAARVAATVWRGRLALATGVVVLAMGFYTLNGGLELAGSPLAASRITESIGFEPPAADASAAVVADGVQTRQSPPRPAPTVPRISKPSRASRPRSSSRPTEHKDVSGRWSSRASASPRCCRPAAKPASTSALCSPAAWTTPAVWACTRA